MLKTTDTQTFHDFKNHIYLLEKSFKTSMFSRYAINQNHINSGVVKEPVSLPLDGYPQTVVVEIVLIEKRICEYGIV